MPWNCCWQGNLAIDLPLIAHRSLGFPELLGAQSAGNLYLIPAQQAAHVCVLRRITAICKQRPTCEQYHSDFDLLSFRRSVDLTGKGSVHLWYAYAHLLMDPLSLAKMCRE